MNVLLHLAMGHQARQAHQEDVRYVPGTDALERLSMPHPVRPEDQRAELISAFPTHRNAELRVFGLSSTAPTKARATARVNATDPPGPRDAHPPGGIGVLARRLLGVSESTIYEYVPAVGRDRRAFDAAASGVGG
ncbi:hypothetical protein [Nocardia terpenica]|uniref:Uncharacterized protein n=1 Tax=Nocardia terpenica TaxID=455432 RepID=A0A6G9Z9F1_9NOCA|nr:hypothetical protein [Nocardia terpenica]QIS22112.1 hypothetical protein F6W96_30965 [Nocardia terpenica]